MLYKDVKIALKPVPFPYRGHLPSKSFLSGAFKYAFRISNAATEPSRTDLSPLSPHCYKLFVVAKAVNSLVFNQFHTLVANHPG
jgi:hypothetical protein